MSNINWPEEFISFLKRNGLYEPYLEAYYLPAPKISLKDFLSKTKPYFYLDLAFVYKCTRQGHYFWRRVDDCWEKVIKSLEEESK